MDATTTERKTVREQEIHPHANYKGNNIPLL